MIYTCSFALSEVIHMAVAEMFELEKMIPNAAFTKAPSILSMPLSFRNPSKEFKKQFCIGTGTKYKYSKMYQLYNLNCGGPHGDFHGSRKMATSKASFSSSDPSGNPRCNGVVFCRCLLGYPLRTPPRCKHI